MPLYDYTCPKCGRFSAFRPMSMHDKPQPCPECGTESPKALTGPRFVGGGALTGGGGGGYRHMGGCGCCPTSPG